MNNREVFEAWYKKEIDAEECFMRNKDNPEHYLSLNVHFAYKCWQAALASQAQQPYDHDLGSVLIALENAINDLKGIIYNQNLKPYIDAKDKLAAYLQSQAQQPTELSKQLREYAADSGYSHNDYADTMLAAASEIERCAARLAPSQAQQPAMKLAFYVDPSTLRGITMSYNTDRGVIYWRTGDYCHEADVPLYFIPPAPEGGDK